jgi:hypothetical protein
MEALHPLLVAILRLHADVPGLLPIKITASSSLLLAGNVSNRVFRAPAESWLPEHHKEDNAAHPLTSKEVN